MVALITGAFLFCILYAVPVVGFLVWSLVGTLGFGAVMMAIFRSFRSEQPDKVTVPSSAVAPEDSAAVEGGDPPLVDSVELVRAGFWIRVAATVVDFLLVGTFNQLDI